jgi:hypothetical protein
MNEWRPNRKIKDTDVYQVIDKLLFQSPELINNQWFKHRIDTIGMLEDEGERAPPTEPILDDVDDENRIEVVKEEKSLVEMLLEDIIKKGNNKEREEETEDD